MDGTQGAGSHSQGGTEVMRAGDRCVAGRVELGKGMWKGMWKGGGRVSGRTEDQESKTDDWSVPFILHGV